MSNKWLMVIGILGGATLAHGAITGPKGGTAAFAGGSCANGTCLRGSTASNGVQNGTRAVMSSSANGGIKTAGGSYNRTRATAVTGPNGSVGSTRNTTAVNNGDGTATINTSLTGVRGTRSQSFTVKKN